MWKSEILVPRLFIRALHFDWCVYFPPTTAACKHA